MIGTGGVGGYFGGKLAKAGYDVTFLAISLMASVASLNIGANT